jgi:hypothetical protein
LEAAKLVTAAMAGATLERRAVVLRVPLTIMVLALMTLTAIGRFGFPLRADLTRQRQLVDQNLP